LLFDAQALRFLAMPKSKGGSALATWLEKNQRSQHWLAKEVGVHQTTVRLWLNGSLPSVKWASKIEKVTGIAVGQWAS
jgi:ribosome-binding protein aMBF1 (putative translation factor)